MKSPSILIILTLLVGVFAGCAGEDDGRMEEQQQEREQELISLQEEFQEKAAELEQEEGARKENLARSMHWPTLQRRSGVG